jgi:hypothetical protein
MNKHVPPTELGMPPLTPAERVEALMDAFVKYQQLERATQDLRDRLISDVVRTASREMLCDQIEEGARAGNRARIEVVAHVKILMGDGILERCAEMLKIETIGRP